MTKYSDIISTQNSLTGWAFSVPALKAVGSSYFIAPVFKAVFQALGNISRSPDAEIRESAFTIWVGENEDLRIAIPSEAPSEVKREIGDAFNSIPGSLPGYLRQVNFSISESLALNASYRYFQGKVKDYHVEPDNDELIGKGYIDGSDHFGSQLPVFYWVNEDLPYVAKQEELYKDRV